MNETDFINTMFLRSTFFENWSETNYFISPTLKTSQTLTYNDKWYLDFLKDSYSTGISFYKLSDEFMDYIKIEILMLNNIILINLVVYIILRF